ncbi:hypothetical protein ATANTOWER_000558 [Ataeniobius toweri]|uniref:Secreted protein n=1 Tax=Ataeniobius toweri TaxID=208326 RepID=A0ABU7A476_9TELE|nr:hypothetical protein [Ataeniobius toweri]
MILSPVCFTVGIMLTLSTDAQCCFCAKHISWNCCPKLPVWVCPTNTSYPEGFERFKPGLNVFFERKGFSLTSLHLNQEIWKIQRIVVTCKTHKVLDENLCCSLCVSVNLLGASFTMHQTSPL